MTKEDIAKEFVMGNREAGVRVAVKADGIEISAGYDGGFGIEGGSITWEALDEARKSIKDE